MYSSIGIPGTLEISTLPAGTSRSASPERPYSDASPESTHGAPVNGTSAASTGLSALTTLLASSDEAWIALKRAVGSARSVARSTRIADTWLFIDVSSAVRRLTGTMAISGLSGSRLRSARNLRSADAHIAITTVLTVPPARLPSAFISFSPRDIVAYERWLVIEALKIVLGAWPAPTLRPPWVPGRLASIRATVPTALAPCGSILPSLVYCALAFDTAARSSSTTPS